MVLHNYDRNGLLLAHSVDDTPDPFYYVMHAHDVCELYYFMGGKGYFTVEGVNYPLESGALLLIRDGEMHALHIDPSVRYERVTVNFAYETVDPTGTWSGLRAILYDRELGKGAFTGLRASGEYVKTLFHRLMKATEVEGADGDMEVKILFHAILAEIVAIRRGDPHAHEALDATCDLKIGRMRRNEAKIVFEIIAYINSNLFEIKSLGEIEARFYFSRSYINRIFKAATGTSVWNYVLLKRLIAAQGMLKSGMPAATVAARCGFRDYSSFYKQYKNKMGVAPTEEKNIGAAERSFSVTV